MFNVTRPKQDKKINPLFKSFFLGCGDKMGCLRNYSTYINYKNFTFFVYITERKGMLFDKLHHLDWEQIAFMHCIVR